MEFKMDSSKISHLINQVFGILNYMKLIGFDEIYFSKKFSNNLVNSNKNIIDYYDKSKHNKLLKLKAKVSSCKRCCLHNNRKNIVFGEGKENSNLLFIGEGPGKEEDNFGRPFVGAAGKLLNRIIKAMKLDRKEVYICNIVKCRPPGNRNPNIKEVKKCIPYLKKQINIISPKIICLLGSVALKSLLNKEISISNIRGTFIKIKGIESIKIMPTYHPAYLLRNPKAKKEVWEDMKKIMEALKY